MQIHRLLEMVYLLLDKKKVTAKELSEKFEVSERTIYRDLQTLSASGIPIYTMKGKDGGISLMDSYVLNKSLLSEKEQNEILYALQGLSAANYPNADLVLEKMRSLFQRGEEDWIDVDFTHWSSGREEKKIFQKLKCAVTEKRRIKFDYYNASGEKSTRETEPHKLYFKEKAWYLYAYCLQREEFRFFRITRMENVKVTDTHFVKRLPSIEEKKENVNWKNVSLTLRFSPAVSYRILDDFQRSCITWEPDGSLLVQATIPENEWVYGYLLSFGEHVTILEPERIRNLILEKCLATIKKYQ